MNIKAVLSGQAIFTDRYVPDFVELERGVKHLKDGGYTIVLTQGVFDMLHIGHAKYLQKAKDCGDILIVGVDSDELTRSRKEPNRPLVPEEERLALLACLRSVDIITLRTFQQDIGELVRLVKPDVLIVSETTKDFPPDLVAVYDECCGRIERLPPQATTSSTARIRQMEIGGMKQMGEAVAAEMPGLIERVHAELTGGKS